MKRHIFFFLLAILVFEPSAFAQAPTTGFPPYGSFENGRFDAVNRQNLNVNFALPIVSSPGRGMNFRLAVVYDSLVWQKVTSGTTTSWTSVTDANGSPTWGWKKDFRGEQSCMRTSHLNSSVFLRLLIPGSGQRGQLIQIMSMWMCWAQLTRLM